MSSSDVPGLPTREQREALASARREADERRRIVEARERFLKGEWKFSKEQQATLDAARERIKAQAAREVLRDEIKRPAGAAAGEPDGGVRKRRGRGARS